MGQFEHVFQRVGVEHLVGPGFKIGRGRLGHPLLDFGGKGTESPPQQPLQHNPLPVDATLPHSLFHSLPHPPLKTLGKALLAAFRLVPFDHRNHIGVGSATLAGEWIASLICGECPPVSREVEALCRVGRVRERQQRRPNPFRRA